MTTAKKMVIRWVTAGLLVLLAACQEPQRGPPPKAAPTPVRPEDFTLEMATQGLDGQGELFARIVTNHGAMVARLFSKEAPNTVANFVGLARGTRPFQDPKTGTWKMGKFYDGLTFHRIIPGFMIQGGDPLGLGVGGPGYAFSDEIHATLFHDRPGILSMANSGPNTNGSQFFITERPTPHLDRRHTIFGVLVEGIEVQRAIANLPAQSEVPIDPVRIEAITIERRATGASATSSTAVIP